MAHPADVARGRNIVARWCNLAEQRLEYLTELFESGRWRRYHTELEFLENIQEAKAAVETWRDLMSREAALENTAIDMAWLGRRRTTPLLLTPLPRDEGFRQPVVQLQPAPVAGARRRLPPRRGARFPLMFWSRWKASSLSWTRCRPCPTRRRWTKCRCRRSVSTR